MSTADVIEFGGWSMPATERHMNAWMTEVRDTWEGRLSYQGHKIRKAFELCEKAGKQFDTAIDIGAHIGTWSYYFAKRFKRVYAWEPVELHAKCFERNVDTGNVTLFREALGESEGVVRINAIAESTGDSHVVGRSEAGIEARMTTLDSRMDAISGAVDLMKIDCEGYEYFILRGAEAVIIKHKPVVVVEQKPGKAQRYGMKETEAVTWMKAFGYRVEAEISGDFFMVA